MGGLESAPPKDSTWIWASTVAILNLLVLAAAVENRLDGLFDDRAFAVVFLIVSVAAPLGALAWEGRAEHRGLSPAEVETRTWRTLLIGSFVALPFSAAVIASSLRPR